MSSVISMDTWDTVLIICMVQIYRNLYTVDAMLLSLPTRSLPILFCVENTLRRLLYKGIRYWKFTWQRYIYPDDTYVNGNPGLALVCFVFLWNFNQRWTTRSTVTLLESYITQVYSQTALYYWVCQRLQKTFFQIINICSISGQNPDSPLVWH